MKAKLVIGFCLLFLSTSCSVCVYLPVSVLETFCGSPLLIGILSGLVVVFFQYVRFLYLNRSYFRKLVYNDYHGKDWYSQNIHMDKRYSIRYDWFRHTLEISQESVGAGNWTAKFVIRSIKPDYLAGRAMYDEEPSSSNSNVAWQKVFVNPVNKTITIEAVHLDREGKGPTKYVLYRS